MFGMFPPEMVILIAGMFIVAAVVLQIALGFKLRGAREKLSRSTKWWVTALTVGVIAAAIGIGYLFQHVMRI